MSEQAMAEHFDRANNMLDDLVGDLNKLKAKCADKDAELAKLQAQLKIAMPALNWCSEYFTVATEAIVKIHALEARYFAEF